jgi:hypothetical protein
MATPLQTLYDRFISKIDEDLTGKESLIFALIEPAISKSKKYVVHDLTYILTDVNSYEGNFVDTLDNDEIELLALWMLYEWNRREQQRLVKLKNSIGTKDFNRLPDKADELKVVNLTMKEIKNDIDELKNEFNTYKYN